MSEFKGTKGKWYLQEYTDAYTHIIRCDNGEHQTLWVASTGQDSRKEARCNALLISKAPEMLEFLTQLRYACENGLIQDLEELGESAKKLIKSATEL